jgi:hypothetical protein
LAIRNAIGNSVHGSSYSFAEPQNQGVYLKRQRGRRIPSYLKAFKHKCSLKRTDGKNCSILEGTEA